MPPPARKEEDVISQQSMLDSRDFPFLSISFSAPSLHWLENHHLLPLSLSDSTHSVAVTEQQPGGTDLTWWYNLCLVLVEVNEADGTRVCFWMVSEFPDRDLKLLWVLLFHMAVWKSQEFLHIFHSPKNLKSSKLFVLFLKQ